MHRCTCGGGAARTVQPGNVQGGALVVIPLVWVGHSCSKAMCSAHRAAGRCAAGCTRGDPSGLGRASRGGQPQQHSEPARHPATGTERHTKRSRSGGYSKGFRAGMVRGRAAAGGGRPPGIQGMRVRGRPSCTESSCRQRAAPAAATAAHQARQLLACGLRRLGRRRQQLPQQPGVAGLRGIVQRAAGTRESVQGVRGQGERCGVEQAAAAAAATGDGACQQSGARPPGPGLAAGAPVQPQAAGREHAGCSRAWQCGPE
jgi:hypothetical protein